MSTASIVETRPEHSPIGASSYDRWGNCPGSVALSKGLPNEESEYAKEGTLAHEYAAKLLNNTLTLEDVEAMPPEMFEAIEFYKETVMQAVREAVDTTMLVEHKFDLTDLYPNLYGTADAVVHVPWRDLIQVYDFKYGAGVAVEVEENEQLLYYALGALLKAGFKASKVEIIVVQPRCDHEDGVVRRWSCQATSLIEFAATLVDNARKTDEPNAPLKTGSWCRWCPAAGICPEKSSKALTAAQRAFSPIDDVAKYSLDELALTLSKLEIVESWAESVRRFAYSAAQAGQKIPGFKLVNKRAMRHWVSEPAVKDALFQAYGSQGMKQFHTEPKFKSVSQVEAILKENKHSKNYLDGHVISKSSGTNLVPMTHKGEEVVIDKTAGFAMITDASPQNDSNIFN